ncbi:MAG TPA: hypothetical protein VHX88_18395 [Solirubrobacteraceae bacterium]|nr:hypothetical protein [Solirubrobacteraceae bacterium]
MIALLSAAPLQATAGVPFAQLAVDAPMLCAATMRALGSDSDLARLSAGGELRPLAARTLQDAGLSGPAGALAAAEALRGALWGALQEHLGGADARTVGDLCDRLAHVCVRLASAALASEQIDPLVAELERDGPLHTIDARDRRTPSWTAEIQRRLERFAQDGRPFSVLLVELDGIDRLRRAEIDDDVSAAVRTFEGALGPMLGPGDALLREAPGRYWLIAPETDEEAAGTLAERLAAAAPAGAEHRGVALRAVVGVARCPAGGGLAEELQAQAERGVYAARASGR